MKQISGNLNGEVGATLERNEIKKEKFVVVGILTSAKSIPYSLSLLRTGDSDWESIHEGRTFDIRVTAMGELDKNRPH